LSLETVGLVDTGATQSLIPREIAEVLMLEYEEGEGEVWGAGGVFTAQLAKLKKLVLLKNVTPFASFLEVKVLVPEREGILPYAILGRDYTFKRFDITFHEKRQKMTFTKT